MKMSWYYRMLLSYTPIFFVVISVLMFSFFAVLNNSAQNQIAMTDEAIATKVMQALDVNLKASERIIVKELYTNETLQQFFNDGNDKMLYDYFLISEKMDQFSSMLPFASSIYLYSETSDKVLSRSGLSVLDQFGDSAYLSSAYHSGSNPAGWTDPRPFKEFVHDSSEERVVSLVRFYPVTGEKRGAVVINIRVSALTAFVHDLTRYDSGYNQLFASNLAPFDRNGVPLNKLGGGKRKPGPVVVSDYTGWSYASHGQSAKGLSLLSLFNNLWLMVGLAAIVIGLTWFTYITHRNYKPIQAIAGRIRDYSKRKSSELVRHASHNELKFIESAIDGLLEKTSLYEQLHKDDLPIRKRQMFFDWLEGNTVMTEAEWQREMDLLRLPVDYERLTAAVMRIDRFSHFNGTYNAKDQYLLKFVLTNVLQEIAQTENIFVWNEWIEPRQMAVVFYLNDPEDAYQEKVCRSMKKLQEWIKANLEFTVSVGIGPDTYSPGDIPRSYGEAKALLSYKPVFGTNCMIGGGDIHSKEEGQIFPHLQMVRTIAQSFRLDNGHWQLHLTELFQSLKKELLSQADMENLTNYLLYHLHKELMEMNEDIQQLWKNNYISKLEAVADFSETLEEWYEQLCALLAELEPQTRALRSAKYNHTLMNSVKEYIEQCYADPDLSLNRISERFEMNPRYLSKLFKEKFGEKFIDYMLRLRLEEAKKLLVQTDLPIQDIAERVGYVHVISFHRAFKNMFGLPPGDFRKRTETR